MNRWTAAFSVVVSMLLVSFPAASAPPLNPATAVFAGGCFWSMQRSFEEVGVPGIIKVTAGYAGGTVKNPTYEQVSSGGTGHLESIQVIYDPLKITYEKLLQLYWHNIDPFVANAQYCDSGTEYQTAIIYQNDDQKKAAEAAKASLQGSAKFHDHPVLTEIIPGAFYPAEDYHQDFYKKNPVRYNSYRYGCGRDGRLKELWGAAAEH